MHCNIDDKMSDAFCETKKYEVQNNFLFLLHVTSDGLVLLSVTALPTFSSSEPFTTPSRREEFQVFP
jgi:hypothetical protein